MTLDLTLLGADIDRAVAAVPGVERQYAAEPATVRAARELTGGPAALSKISSKDGQVEIVVSVGMGAGDAGADARRVADAVRAAVAASAPPASVDPAGIRVHVRISRLDLG
jgi:hypothetical protein